MVNQTKIEWTNFTVNFWEGCQNIGPGCDHCYAEARDKRFTGGEHWGPGAPRRKVKGGIAKLRKINRDAPEFAAKHGRFPRVFCSSLSDVFDNAVDKSWRRDAFAEIDVATDTRVQLLTKRVSNVFQMIPPMWANGGWPSHVGLMITVVNQDEANRDIPKLLDLKTRLDIPWVGLSVEPMLGPINLLVTDTQGHDISSLTGIAVDPSNPDGPDEYYRTGKMDWVICGGESGSSARPMHPQWARSLRDQCKAAGTPFLFKQWGEWKSISQMADESEYTRLYRSIRKAKEHEDQDVIDDIYGQRCAVAVSCLQLDGNHRDELDIGAWGVGAILAFKIGKKAAGRLLDGEEHNGLPALLGGDA